LRYISIITLLLASSVAFGTCVDEPKEIKGPTPGESEVPKRLQIKPPLPSQLPLLERTQARGEINVVAIINRDGTIQKITEITGSPTVKSAYKTYIQGIQFVPTLKSDPGPWLVTLRIVCSSSGFNPPIRTTMNIKILDVQDHPITAH